MERLIVPSAFFYANLVEMKPFLWHWDLQAKISLVLASVIIPTFLIITVAQNQITLPLLEDEIKQIGIHSAKMLAKQVAGKRAIHKTAVLESLIQETLYSQPDITRIDLLSKEGGSLNVIASSSEEEDLIKGKSPEGLKSEFLNSDEEQAWDIWVPFEKGKKFSGFVHLVISTKTVQQMGRTLWKTTAGAAFFSVISLLFALSYFLRKTIADDRLLRKAESANLQLTEKLHDLQRQILTNEKFAVMGQLTASFAHEIGTPLNAVGGHLQLLKEDLASPKLLGRLEIIQGQLTKIETIVKSFLESTAKPTSQKQLLDINRLVEKTLQIVSPRIDELGVKVSRKYHSQMGPLRMVPLDLEQVLLNLLNNSLDSLKAKSHNQERSYQPHLQIVTDLIKDRGNHWGQISVRDSGEGIKKSNLENVFKPFFTTKAPGEGTGLGLAICQEIAKKYQGDLLIDSKEGAWTLVALKLPYEANL